MVHHSADATSLLYLSDSIKKLDKLINADLKHLVKWLNGIKSLLIINKPLGINGPPDKK